MIANESHPALRDAENIAHEIANMRKGRHGKSIAQVRQVSDVMQLSARMRFLRSTAIVAGCIRHQSRHEQEFATDRHEYNGAFAVRIEIGVRPVVGWHAPGRALDTAA
ncbi:MAG: hypothetical protein DMG14_11085 [Acidobacteria bacterium]|nr:MAG: hypothetical protein DMG14_11085 [Acidobacteriota bacterium]